MGKHIFNAKSQRRRGFVVSWIIILLVGCQAVRQELAPTPILPAIVTTMPTETAVSTSSRQATTIPTPPTPPPTNLPTSPAATIEPTATINPDTSWQEVQPGLERRHIYVFDEENQPRDRLTILRLDPAFFDVRVAYRPGEAHSLEAWQAETDALITVNGGFFTAENYATGLTIVDGQLFGASYGDFAGMLSVTEAEVEVRWLRERPFTPDEPLQYAVQSFPVLVKPDGVLGFPEEDGVPARRTVVAQDRNGNLLFIIAPGGLMTLHQMSQWLVSSDLDLHIALNLDGGPSTGLLLANSDLAISAFSPLPAVIIVNEK
jgi:uncharacterized protein YigE (DUF2233 family)